MRITSTMMMENYAKTLDDKYGEINKYSNEISTTRAFQRGSDDPVANMQTIEDCHDYTLNAQFQNSDSQATDWMGSTESTVDEINDVLKTAQEKVTEAANGTNSDSDNESYATALENYRDEIVSTLNTSYNGQYIFGQSDSDNAPFKLGTADDGDDNNGKLLAYNYNYPQDGLAEGYVSVDSLTADQAQSMKLSMPINLGTSGSFDGATSGLDTVISDYAGAGGTAEDIVTQINNVVTQLNGGDTSGLSGLLTNIQNAQSAVLNVDVNVGEKSNMLTEVKQRLTDDQTNITSGLATSMEVDSTQAIMNYNTSETVYKEAMSIASTVLQNSLVDFLK